MESCHAKPSLWNLIIAFSIGVTLVFMPAAHGKKVTADFNNDKNEVLECDQEQGTSGLFNNTKDGPFDESPVALEDKSAGKWRRVKIRHKRQTAIVGVPCQENIDCQTTNGGAYCDSTKRCDCLPAYININGYCWAKRNPDDSCQYMEQCTSVSPNTYCDTSGTCRCNNNQPAFRTADGDGPFCLLPGECPTNGPNSKLRDPDTGTPVKCEGDFGLKCQDKDMSSGPNDIMYHCICAKPTTDIPGSPCAMTEDAYCCPSRASACIQSKDEGTFVGGGIPQQRWWFNSASGNCEALSYRGSAGNGNNFLTKAICESYCKTVCPRGTPLSYTAGCSISTNCGNTQYYCNTEGKTVNTLCCPRASFVCSAQGGMPNPPATMPDIGDRSYNVRNNTNRWYYDSGINQCRTFPFRGYGGTFNNFHTETECRMYCSSTVCPAGEPLRDSGGTVVNCGSGGSAVCPMKYECSATGNVCCPSRNFVCSQPQSIGACSSFMERWWFNPKTRACEKFFYSGCQGNFNNFPTYQSCSDYCTPSAAVPICPQGEAAKESGGVNYIVCSGAGVTVNSCPSDYFCHFDGTRYGCCATRTKTCQVDNQDAGTQCVTPVSRWYYNAQTRTCDVFTYNGCDGNSNNFATKIDCQDYCGVGGCPEGGEPFRDTVSSATFRVCGPGGGDCPVGYTCSIVTLGTTSRYNYCCPTRSSICTMGQDAGVRCGSNTLNRYFFNMATRTCEMFTYNGCGGNRNNFASVEQCLTYCNSAGCPSGQVALQDAVTRRVTPCEVSQGISCPSNYRCAFSNVLQQGVCCGSNAPIGACPSGQIAYMDSFTSSPMQCQPNVDSSCPNGIFCQYSFALSNSFCCSTQAAQCPQGGDPYFESMGSLPRQCTPGLPNVCPQGYTCQATTVVIGTVTSATGYCCGQSNICGTGYAPYYVNNQPVPCVLNQVPSNCPVPFTCRQNVNNQQSYCCAISGQMTPVCAAGKEPYLIQGSPTLCTQNSPSTSCPAGYSCDLYTTTGSFYCCRFGGINPPTTGCPSPYTLLQPVRTCSPGAIGACPVGYFCNWDQAGSRYVCCGTGGVIPPSTGYCPFNSQPYMNPSTGQPQICMLGTPVTGCPTVGYRCAYSTTYRQYYCCTGTSGGGGGQYGCPFGTAYLYPGTRTPLACTRTGAPCPVGYSCQQSTISNMLQCCSNVARETGTATRTNVVAGPQPSEGGSKNPAPAVPVPAIPANANGRKCSNNFDCRDSNGKVNLCVKGYCRD